MLWPASALLGSTCSAATAGSPQLRRPPQRSRRASVRTPSALPKRSAGLALGQSPAVTSKISKRQDFFPGALAVKTLCFQRRGHHCDPGWVMKIPQASWGSQKKEK